MAKFCSDCGTPLTPGAKFCPQCGTRVADAPAPAPQTFPTAPAPGSFPVSPAPAFQSPKPQSKGSSLLCILLAVIMVAELAIAGFVSPGWLKKSKDNDPTVPELTAPEVTTVRTDEPVFAALSAGNAAVSTYDGVTVDFMENAAEVGGNVVLGQCASGEGEIENGLSSPLYLLETEQAYSEPVTIRLPVPDSFDPASDQVLQIGVGVDCVYEDGSAGREYFYFDAEVSGQTASCTVIPEEIELAPLYMGSGTANGIKLDAPKFRYTFGIFTSLCYFEDNGHFRLYFPQRKINDKTFYGNVKNEGIYAILTDLEEAYNKYLNMGFEYGDDFPMNVHVKNISDEGAYHTLFKDITLGTKNFQSAYTPGALRPLLFHEFFHYVQGCYVGRFGGTIWIDEATSSYFESAAEGETYTSLTGVHLEKQFSGAIPPDGTSQDGYARAPLIWFLKEKMGGEDWIREVYENGGTTQALVDIVGDPVDWAHEYYTFLAQRGNRESGPMLHQFLVKKTFGSWLGTAVELVIPNAKKQQELIDAGEEIVLAETTLTMNGQSGRYVAFTVSAEALEALPDGPVPTITCNGGEVTILSAGLGREAENCGTEFTGFKNAEAEKTRYIAVVTSEAAPGLSSDVDIKVVLPPNCPTFDELCGDYPDGSVSILSFDITDETRRQMTEMRTMVIGTDEEGNDITCDYNNLPALNALEESVGKTSPMPVAITKTGENAGLLTMIGTNSDAFPIRYNPDNGSFSMNLTENGITFSGRFQAAYAEKQTVVTLVGHITVLLGEGMTVEADASASRPLK